MTWKAATEHLGVRDRGDVIILGMLIVLAPLWLPMLVVRIAWELADGGYHFIEDVIR